MPVTFGNERCLNPADLFRECRRADPPMPIDAWWGKANAYSCPLGPGPGTATILLSRRSLDKLNLNRQYNLVFEDHNRKATFKQLCIVAARCMTPGARDDPNGAMLVDLVDRRVLLRLVGIDKEYNKLDCSGEFDGVEPSGSGPCSGSGPDDSLWEWDQVVCDIWGMMPGLGTYPGLPFSPNDYPHNLTFYASYAFDALNAVLSRLGSALQYNPLADTFGIVRIGQDDTEFTAAIREWDKTRVWDWEPQPDITLANVPAKVRVRFRRYPAPRNNGNPFYTVELNAPTSVTTTTATGSSAIIDDDLPALASEGTPDNSTYLASRAAERRDDYYRLLTDGLNRVYSGIVTDRRLLPGRQVKAIVWRDLASDQSDVLARGMQTEVYRGDVVLPPYELAKFQGPDYAASCTEFVGEGSGSGGTSSEDEGGCCHSGVKLQRFRCPEGVFQKADICLRKEWNFLLRDDQCRVMRDEGGFGGVRIIEYELSQAGSPPVVTLVDTDFFIRENAGVLELVDSTGAVQTDRPALGTGVAIRTLFCNSVTGRIQPRTVVVTLECGRIFLRDMAGELIPGSSCCEEVEDCLATSPGLNWTDTGCTCSGAFCLGDNFPEIIEFIGTGRAGTGCEGVEVTGLAQWTFDASAQIPSPPYPTDLTGIEGWIFNFSVGGVDFTVGVLCEGGEPTPWFIQPMSTLQPGGHGGGSIGPGGEPGDNVLDPGNFQFVLNWSLAGPPCTGYIDFTTSSPIG